MTPDPVKRPDWQLSLATILAFVFAVAIWLLLATRANVMERPHITAGVLFVAIVCAALAYSLRRRAILLLIALFLFIVGGSHGYMRLSHMREMNQRARRNVVLHMLEMSLVAYEGALSKPLAPSTVAAQSGADLHRALMTPVTADDGRTHGPFAAVGSVRVENGVSHITGALGSRLLWAKTVTKQSILVDSGPDNLFGGTLDANGIYTPGPVDANNDGKTDGEDDLIHFVGSHD